MKFAAILIAACALSACAVGGKSIEIQRVNVAVPLECKEPIPDRPVMPTEALRPGATVDQFAQAAQAEIERREGYEGQLLAALVICTRAITPAPQESLGLRTAWPK